VLFEEILNILIHFLKELVGFYDELYYDQNYGENFDEVKL